MVYLFYSPHSVLNEVYKSLRYRIYTTPDHACHVIADLLLLLLLTTPSISSSTPFPPLLTFCTADGTEFISEVWRNGSIWELKMSGRHWIESAQLKMKTPEETTEIRLQSIMPRRSQGSRRRIGKWRREEHSEVRRKRQRKNRSQIERDTPLIDWLQKRQKEADKQTKFRGSERQ